MRMGPSTRVRRAVRFLPAWLLLCALLSATGGSGHATASPGVSAHSLSLESAPTANPASRDTAEQRPEPPIPCRFVDSRGFAWMLASMDATDQPRWRTAFPIDGETPQAAGAAVGMILPHHDVAAPMIGRVLSETADALARDGMMPEVVILMGPNHAREGAQQIQTYPNDWDTPEGVMPAERRWAEELARIHAAAGDPLLMEREHALSYLVPWIHHFFPEASLLPVLLSGALDGKGCETLSDSLSAFTTRKHCLVVASIDFSHDRTPEEALDFDAVTWQRMRDGDADGVLGLDNRYLDAPPTLATFLMTMERMGAGTPVLAGHAEASLFLGRRVEATTSHLAVVFPP